MSTFTYRAKKGPAELLEGQVEAGNRDEAVRRISDLGLVPVMVQEVKPGTRPAQGADIPKPLPKPASPTPKTIKPPGVPQKARKTGGGSFFSRRRIKSRFITLFTRQLASLFRAQVPILRALTLLGERCQNQGLGALIATVRENVKDGKALSVSLQQFHEHFPPFYISMIRSGELSGKLDEILERLASFREKEEEFRMKIKGALAYPVFLLAVGILSIIVLMTVVMPRLMVLFKDMEATLPAPTRALIRVSEFLSTAWPVFLVIGIVCVLIGSSPKGKVYLKGLTDRVRLRIPIVGTLTVNAEMERFCRTLGLLLKSGLAIVQAADATVSTLDNEVLRKELQGIGSDMAGGTTLSGALAKVRSFPPFLRDMIAVGEEGGRLEEILEETANSYALEVEQATKVMTSLIEPILILLLGLVVGFLVAAMLLPIFELGLGVE